MSRGENSLGFQSLCTGKTKGVLGVWKQFRRAVSLIFICGFQNRQQPESPRSESRVCSDGVDVQGIFSELHPTKVGLCQVD